MERRSEPRFETQKTIIVTLLEENNATLPALAVELSGSGMKLVISRRVSVGAAVKVEPDNSMILGEVCYCETHPCGYLIGIKLHQVLSNLHELARLNQRLLGEEPREQPVAEPGKTPVDAPVNAWIGGRSRR